MCRPIIEFSQTVYIINPDFHLILVGYQPALGKVVHSTYTTGTHALPDIYARAFGPAALGLVRIYQAKHSSLWYKYNITLQLSIATEAEGRLFKAYTAFSEMY